MKHNTEFPKKRKSPKFLAAAIDLALRGNRIFPVEFLENDPEGDVNVLDDQASTDLIIIQRWWRKWPHAYPVIQPTEEQCGSIGLDPDSAELTVIGGSMGYRLPWEKLQ